MNWVQSLYETYENCQSMIGTGAETQIPLLPICHTTQKAQIEITLNAKGNFRRARLVSKDESRTIISCTEKSAGRTSGEAPHPLCDKLQYVAADYKQYGGEKKPYHASYLELLAKWVESGAPRKVQLIYAYVQQGNVISDLAAHKILFVDENNKLFIERPREKDKNAPLDIFDLLSGGIDPKTKEIKPWQAEAFIRWAVEIPGDAEDSAVWNDQSVIQSWIEYYSSTKETMDICLVTGEKSFSADQHPAKIRNDGDKAKLIASGKSRNKTGKITVDDGCGFTFLGRFTFPDQAATVGFKTSQKAHSALRWLIARQGYKSGDLAIVAWATSGATVIQPTDDPVDAWDEDAPSEEASVAYTAQEVAIRLKKKIAGYRQELGETAQMVVMAVDSATTGRLSIVYYRTLTSSDFLGRIERWHETCSWYHTYHYDKEQKRYIPFIGAPSPAAIAEAAYGRRLDDNLKKATIKRLLPCIVEGQPIPFDLVESTVRRASNRIGIKNPDDKKYRGDEEYTWKKTLSIACSLYRKFKEGKEKYDMSLDETRTTRDYLYGRLLALADNLENWALRDAGEKRETTAARLMQRFAEHPYSTWRQIELALRPYIARLGGKSFNLQREIDKVVDMFDPKDFTKDTRLSGEFLLGYHSQRQALWQNRSTKEESEE